jgi:hypothetical protein
LQGDVHDLEHVEDQLCGNRGSPYPAWHQLTYFTSTT